MVIFGIGHVVEIDLRGGNILVIHEFLHPFEIAIAAQIKLLSDHVAQAVERILFGLFDGRFVGINASRAAVKFAIVAMQTTPEDTGGAAAADRSIRVEILWQAAEVITLDIGDRLPNISIVLDVIWMVYRMGMVSTCKAKVVDDSDVIIGGERAFGALAMAAFPGPIIDEIFASFLDILPLHREYFIGAPTVEPEH